MSKFKTLIDNRREPNLRQRLAQQIGWLIAREYLKQENNETIKQPVGDNLRPDNSVHAKFELDN